MIKLLKNLPNLLKLSFQGWKEDNASRLSASLAYYTVFSLAPMLVIAIAVAGLIWQRQAVQEQVLTQIQGLVGEEGRIFFSGLLDSTSKPAQGIIATVIGLITLIFGALGLFNALHEALNTIWDVKEEGAVQQFFGVGGLYLFCAQAAGLWLGVAWGMVQPRRLTSRVLPLGEIDLGRVASIRRARLEVPGVEEAVVVVEEEAAYLKVYTRRLDWARLQDFEAVRP